MSLPARQQRVLDRIEHSLQACEPRLQSMFAMFTTLARDEAMPWREALDCRPLSFHGWRHRSAPPRRRRPAGTGPWAARGQPPGLRAMTLVTITLLALTPVVLLSLGIRTMSGCGLIRPQHAAAALSWRTACAPGPRLLGHQQLPSG
jgi:hypothetical protein